MRDCNLPLFDLRVLITLRFLEPPGEENKVLLVNPFTGERNTVIDDSFTCDASDDSFSGEFPVIILIGLSFPFEILNGEYIT